MPNAFNLRSTWFASCKSKQPIPKRVELLDKYLPLAKSISNIIAQNSTNLNGKEQIYWLQSPLVSKEFQERKFPISHFHFEILHLVWTRGLYKMAIAQLQYDREIVIQELKEACGIFLFLSNDFILSYDSSSFPPEFSKTVFEMFYCLCLAEIYAMIGQKGEDNKLNPATVGILLNQSYLQYERAWNLFPQLSRPDLISKQFQNWVESMMYFSKGLSRMFLGFSLDLFQYSGMVTGLFKSSYELLSKIPSIDKTNTLINETTNQVLEHVVHLYDEYRQKCASIYGKTISPENEVNNFTSEQFAAPFKPIPISPYQIPS